MEEEPYKYAKEPNYWEEIKCPNCKQWTQEIYRLTCFTGEKSLALKCYLCNKIDVAAKFIIRNHPKEELKTERRRDG